MRLRYSRPKNMGFMVENNVTCVKRTLLGYCLVRFCPFCLDINMPFPPFCSTFITYILNLYLQFLWMSFWTIWVNWMLLNCDIRLAEVFGIVDSWYAKSNGRDDEENHSMSRVTLTPDIASCTDGEMELNFGKKSIWDISWEIFNDKIRLFSAREVNLLCVWQETKPILWSERLRSRRLLSSSLGILREVYGFRGALLLGYDRLWASCAAYLSKLC